MRQQRLGSTDVELPIIGQGTWDLPPAGYGRRQAIAALRCGIEQGMVHIDTAEMYDDGAVEELLAEAVAPIPRRSLLLTSKVVPGNATYGGTIAACERSLRRLGTEYLDLYLLHWPSQHPLEETMRAFGTLVASGKVRYVGVSNFDLDEMRQAQSYLGSVPLTVNQVLYHPLERGIERRLLPYCAQHRIAIVGYTPFARGRIAARALSGDGVLGRIAARHTATPRQVILAFLTRLPALFAIPKAATVPHVMENAGAGDLCLDDAEIAQIDAAFPIGEDAPLATL
ncbi:MAG: aldo/keto reductase [Vulcanimicrobiaceae bacterium]